MSLCVRRSLTCSNELGLGPRFVRSFCSFEGEFPPCLYGDTEFAIDPVVNVLRLDRVQRVADRVGCPPPACRFPDGWRKLGIYKLEGDNLTICFRALVPGGDDVRRPTEFHAKEGSRAGLAVYKRRRRP